MLPKTLQEYTLDDAIQDVGNGAIDPERLEAWLKELRRRRRQEESYMKTPNEHILLGKLGAMADAIGDGTCEAWTDSECEEVAGAIDEVIGRFNGVCAQRDAYRKARDEFCERWGWADKERDKAKKRVEELTKRIYTALIDLGAPLPERV